MAERQYWLVKSEPETYSIDDLERDGSTSWDGIRNYTARNLMRDRMRVGDGVLFYHSNADPPGVAGVARVVSEPHPDALQFDPESDYHDPKATRDAPRWWVVDIGFVAKLDRVVPLAELKDDPELAEMPLVQKGQRLSVQPVEARHWHRVCALAGYRDPG